MTSRLSKYPVPSTIRSSLVRNPPEAIPSLDELEQLHVELKALRQNSVDRAKKAGEDLRTIEESMQRMKAKEKGKARVHDKVKRERDYTPALDVDDTKSLSAYSTHSNKPRLGSQPLASGANSTSRSSMDPRRTVLDKKKKRKREYDDSDVEPEAQRHKGTPPVQVQPPPLKVQKSIPAPAPAFPKPSTGPEFTVPQIVPLLAPRPPVSSPPPPGPSKATDVVEDFSKLKPHANPTQASTFFTGIEAWLRPIREEDVGFLEYTGDEVEPFIMPKLGRHYLEVWEDQDAGLYPGSIIPEQQDASPLTFEVPAPKWEPSTLSEPDLLNEEKGHGPLTERVLSALLTTQDHTAWKGVKAAEDAMEGRPGGSGAAAARRERMNAADLEARIRDTMRLHGLLDGVPDYTEKVDDPISTALRQAQLELRQVMAMNKARKARLVSVARDRLGYQEYIELRDSIDNNITALYNKLLKKDQPKANKKKKKPESSSQTEGSNGTSAAPLPPCPAARGFITDDEFNLRVSDQLKLLVETRRQWVDTVGAVFEQKQRENPGRIWGMPNESMYTGLDDEIREMLLHEPPPEVTSGQGATSSFQHQNHGYGGQAPSIAVNGMKLRASTAPSHAMGGKIGSTGHVNGNTVTVNGIVRPIAGNLKGKDRVSRSDAMDVG